MHVPLERLFDSQNQPGLSYKSVMKKRDLIYLSMAAMVDIRLCVHLSSATVTGFIRNSSFVL